MRPRSKNKDKQNQGNSDYENEPHQITQPGPVDTDPAGEVVHFRPLSQTDIHPHWLVASCYVSFAPFDLEVCTVAGQSMEDPWAQPISGNESKRFPTILDSYVRRCASLKFALRE